MEYSFDFSERMLDAARLLGERHDGDAETARAVVYQSFLSIEISLKCLLEHAGMHPTKIRKLNHGIENILETVDSIQKGDAEIEPWDKLSGETVDSDLQNGSFGLLLSLAAEGSTYPNKIRYGNQVRCIEPYLVVKMAQVALVWCRSNAMDVTYVPANK